MYASKNRQGTNNNLERQPSSILEKMKQHRMQRIMSNLNLGESDSELEDEESEAEFKTLQSKKPSKIQKVSKISKFDEVEPKIEA